MVRQLSSAFGYVPSGIAMKARFTLLKAGEGRVKAVQMLAEQSGAMSSVFVYQRSAIRMRSSYIHMHRWIVCLRKFVCMNLRELHRISDHFECEIWLVQLGAKLPHNFCHKWPLGTFSNSVIVTQTCTVQALHSILR